MVPLPIPPKLGLQEQAPILSIFGVTNAVLAPDRAAAAQASAPAWPPPTTMTSKGLEGDMSVTMNKAAVPPILPHGELPAVISHGRQKSPATYLLLARNNPIPYTWDGVHFGRNSPRRSRK